MSDLPHYRDQPATLDPRVEIPEDAPRAMGHGEDDAADVVEANVAHKEAVEAEQTAVADAQAAGEPVPGEPGDPTVRIDRETGEAIESDPGAVPDGTVDDVLDWVGDDPGRASRALTAEKAGQNRTTLVTKLETIAG